MLIIVHLIGLALGVGGASVTDVLVMTAIKNNKLTSSQYDFIAIVSKVVTIGLALLIASGVGFVIYYSMVGPELLRNPKLMAKLTVVLIIAVNALVLHGATMPVLWSLRDKVLIDDVFRSKLTLFFTAGAISVTSWYTALFLGVWKNPGFTFNYVTIISIYAVLLVGGIIFSNIVGRFMINKFSTVK